MTEIEHLVKMANQIADNFSFHEDCVERVTDHLGRFWAPSMKRSLREYLERGGDGVSDAVKAALEGAGSP